MNDILEQLEWEDEMIARGVSRFRKQQDRAIEGRPHESSAGSRLLKSYVVQVSDNIRLYLDRKHPDRKWKRQSPAAKLLGTIETDKVAMFALREVIGSLFSPTGNSIQSICVNIGMQCEDELRFVKFEAEFKEYYATIIRDFQRKNTVSYSFRRRVLTTTGQQHGLDWKSWTRQECFGVGALVLSLLMEVCDLVEKKRAPRRGRGFNVVLVATDKCVDWIHDHNTAMELLSPDRMPCIIPPDDWTTPWEGGYWGPRLRGKTPLVKARQKDRTRDALMTSAVMPVVYDAINKVQRTAWRVNASILLVMQQVWAKNLGMGMPRSEPYEMPKCPLPSNVRAKELDKDGPQYRAFLEWKATAREIHTIEKERVAKNLALSRTLRIARELENRDSLWFVHQLDFRGRMYSATSGLSHQGTDQSKALLEFRHGKELRDSNGVKWFLINGANKFGYDKVSFEERIEFIRDRAEEWKAIASDPLGHRGWAEADKPYQFLAFCIEFGAFAELDRRGPEHGFGYVSHLPVSQDGSCNGLQHFSAMLRDEVGAKATNLSNTDKPEDIYQTVADVAYGKLLVRAKAGDGAALNWLERLDGGIPRKLAKKPVMTMPYGSTSQACTASIYAWIVDNITFEKNTAFRHALYLSPILWESIGEVVIAARAAMTWIQNSSSKITDTKSPLSYTSVIGFPIFQANHRFELREIETQIGGRLRLRFATDCNEYDKRKQRQGSAPNLVHSVDATHMMLAITSMYDTDFAMIHDDFGVPACDTEHFRSVIRETFYELHSSNDILADFKAAHSEVDLDELPAKGAYDISDVLKSDYFFG